MRLMFIIALSVLIVGAATAAGVSPSEEIIEFGQTNSASGSGSSCSNKLDLTATCNDVLFFTLGR